MENTIFNGQPTTQPPSAAYDYRVYDQVWQRVAPGVDPYAEDATAPSQTQETPSPSVSAPAQVAPRQENDSAATLPGATPNPCCMGTNAQDSIDVLEGFIQEALAESRCCQSLSCNVRNQAAAQLFRRAANEKQAAARELCGAYYLITGTRYAPSVTVEHMHWGSLAEALRSWYHQEACNGLNYARAADAATDQCLSKLFARLSEKSYQLAEDVMPLLGRLVC